jgi:hypothetical protein
LAKDLHKHGIDAWVYAAHGSSMSVLDENGDYIVHYWVETPDYLIDAFPQGLGVYRFLVVSYIEDGYVLIDKSLPLPQIYAAGKPANKYELGIDYYALSALHKNTGYIDLAYTTLMDSGPQKDDTTTRSTAVTVKGDIAYASTPVLADTRILPIGKSSRIIDRINSSA